MTVIDYARRVLNGRTDEYLADERQAFVRECADLGGARCDRYRLYEDYYDGDQRSCLEPRMRRYLEASGVRFTENICATAVDKLAGRLHVEAFQVVDNEKASTWLSKTVWQHNGGDELQTIVHTNTPMLADAFLIASWDEKAGLPRYRYNRPGLIKMVYDDDDGEPVYAVKKWATSRRGTLNPDGLLILRLNIFYPDRVEKWFSADKDGEHWAPWTDYDEEAWPVPWTLSGELPLEGEAEDPLGIAVVHFRHKPLGRSYGRSELKTAIPFQEEHTKNILDQFSVMDAQGFAWPWITGVDADAKVTLAVGDILRLTSAEARVGQLPPADPTKLLANIKGTLQRFSAFCDIPLFDLFSDGQPPSGEALKTAEGGLTKKATGCHPGYGNSWKRLQGIGLRLAIAHGDLGFEVQPDADITVVWDSPETRDERAEAETAVFYSELGVSNTTLQRRLGFDPAEEAVLKAKEAPAVPAPPPAP